jgi:hypothetical protein
VNSFFIDESCDVTGQRAGLVLPVSDGGTSGREARGASGSLIIVNRRHSWIAARRLESVGAPPRVAAEPDPPGRRFLKAAR